MLTAINTGSKALTIGELARADEEMPNKEAKGLAQTPMQAPLLQQESRIGAVEVRPPVMLVQIVFFCFTLIRL